MIYACSGALTLVDVFSGVLFRFPCFVVWSIRRASYEISHSHSFFWKYLELFKARCHCMSYPLLLWATKGGLSCSIAVLFSMTSDFPCFKSNGGCSHYCYPGGTTGFTCGCPIGSYLMPDKKNCSSDPQGLFAHCSIGGCFGWYALFPINAKRISDSHVIVWNVVSGISPVNLMWLCVSL